MSLPTQLPFLVQQVRTIRLSFLGVIHKIFQLALATQACQGYIKLASKVVRKSYLCPHAARGYRVKLQRQGYTEQRMTDNNIS